MPPSSPDWPGAFQTPFLQHCIHPDYSKDAGKNQYTFCQGGKNNAKAGGKGGDLFRAACRCSFPPGMIYLKKGRFHRGSMEPGEISGRSLP